MTTKMPSSDTARSILISIRSQHVSSILSGLKSVEFRRRGPYLKVPTKAVIYSSGVDMAITATTTITRVSRLPIDQLWKEFSGVGGIDRQYFYRYFEGCTDGYALVLGSTDELGRPIPLLEMRRSLELIPPQSWRYLDDAKLQEISALGCIQEASDGRG